MPDAIPTPTAIPAPVIPPIVPGQDLGKSSAEDFANANSALDELLKQSTPAEEGDEPTAAEKEAADKASKDAADKAAKEVADKPADKAPETPTAEEIAAAKAEKDAADKAAVTDEFDKVELPSTKPKTVEAFNIVKTQARDRIAAVEKEKAEIAAKLATAEAAVKAGPAPETQKELEELRQFRLKFDVEADPSFKTWDKTVKENEDMIYARLKTAGVDEASIKKIQELGGPGQVDWDAIAEKFPPTLKRYIEGKVFENEDLLEKKKQAIEKAKTNASEFVRTRQEELYQNNEGRQKTTKAEFDAMLPKFEWLKEQPVPPKATAEEKAKIETSNTLIKRVLADVQEALNDDSPQMRAILIAGFAQLMKVRNDVEVKDAAHAAEIAKLQATLAEKEAFIARIKKSSPSRIADKGPSGDAPRPKSSINEEPVDALDRLLKESLAKAE